MKKLPTTLGIRPTAEDMKQLERLRELVRPRFPFANKSDLFRIAIAQTIRALEGAAP